MWIGDTVFRLPLVQSKQNFRSMDMKYRENLKQLIDESAPRFQLDDIGYRSFVAQAGYRTKVRSFYSRRLLY